MVTIEGHAIPAVRRRGAWRVGQGAAFEVLAEPARVTVFGHELGTFAFDCPDPLDRESAVAGQDMANSPMPGLVRAVLVVVGQEVAQGDRLVVIESMKMEHALSAARDGRVAEVLVSEGQQVDAGAPLVRLGAEDG